MRELLKLSKKELLDFFYRSVDLYSINQNEDKNGRYMIIQLSQLKKVNCGFEKDHALIKGFNSWVNKMPKELKTEKFKIPYDQKLFFSLMNYSNSEDVNGNEMRRVVVKNLLEMFRSWENHNDDKIVAYLKVLQQIPINSEEFLELEPNQFYPTVSLNLDKDIKLDSFYYIYTLYIYASENTFSVPLKCNKLNVYGGGKNTFELYVKESEDTLLQDILQLYIKGTYRSVKSIDVFDIIDNGCEIDSFYYAVGKGDKRAFEYLGIFNKAHYCNITFGFKERGNVLFKGENVKRSSLTFDLKENNFLNLKLKSKELVVLNIESSPFSSDVGEYVFDIDSPLRTIKQELLEFNEGRVVVKQAYLLSYFPNVKNISFIEDSKLKEL